MVIKTKLKQAASGLSWGKVKTAITGNGNSIGRKIGAGYAVLAFLVLVIGLTSLFQANGMQNNTSDIVNTMVPALEDIHEVNFSTEHIMAISMQHIQSSDQAVKTSLDEERNQYIRKVSDALKSYEKIFIKGGENAQFREMKHKWDEYLTINNQAVKLSAEGNEELALEVSAKGITAFNAMKTDLEVLVLSSKQEAAAKGELSVRIFRNSLILISITIVISIVIIWLVNIFIRRTMIKPLINVTGHLRRIASGDLTSEDTFIGNRDEIGILAKTVNEMNKSLLDIVTRIRGVSQIIGEHSDILAQAILPNRWRPWRR